MNFVLSNLVLSVSQVVSGNPVASINMVGERAADFIKQDWGIQTTS